MDPCFGCLAQISWSGKFQCVVLVEQHCEYIDNAVI